MALARSRFGWVTLVALAAGCSGGGGGGNNPPPATRTLTVTVAGSGSGTVSSAPSGITCSAGTCTATYAQDTHVTLTATPSGNGSTFAGWSGACGGMGTCPVVLGGDTSVTATFAPPAGVTHTLTVVVAGSGSGTVTSSPSAIACSSGTCGATFAENASVTLTASPSGGGTFAGWTGACTGTGTCTLSMSGDLTATATFAPPSSTTRTLSVTLAGPGSGTVTSSPAGISCSAGTCSATFPENTAVTLTAAPANGGSVFGSWAGACAASGTGTCALTMSGDLATTATFETVQTLTVTVAGDGAGTVTSVPPGISCTTGSGAGCTATFPTNTYVILTATPNAASSFLGWAPTCDALPVPCEFTLGSSTSLTAKFSAWLVHRPFPNVLRSAAVVGSTMIAVGDGGAYLTSADGKSWTGHELASMPPMRGIASDGTTAVAVGDLTAGQGTILTTTDGNAWTLRTSNTTHELFGIVYASGTFVAVGKGGAIVTSSDGGATWTARNSTTTRDLLAVAWGNNTFVATGYGGMILTSSDGGATWTVRTSNTVQALAGVAWRQFRFVAVGSGGAICISSDDGATWTASTYNPGSPPGFVGIAADANRFVAVDSALDVLTSTDGAGWSGPVLHQYADPGSSVALLGASFYVLGAHGGIVRSADAFVTLEYVMPGTGYMPGQRGAAFGGGMYVVVGSGGAIFSSPDGATWTARRAAPNEEMWSVTYGNGAFVAVSTVAPAVGNQYTAFLRSTDGITWTATGSGAPWGVARFGGGTFVAMTTNNTDTSFSTSPDGATWTARPGIAGKRLVSSLAYGASNFVATGPFGEIFSNPAPASGAAWIPESSPTTNSLNAIEYGNGTFVTVDRGTSHDVYTSPNGQTWTAHSSSSPLNDVIAFGNGLFRTSAQTSTDGISWADAPVPMVRGELPGYHTGVATATYGGPAGWVAAKSIWTVLMQQSSIVFLTHP